MPQNNALKDMLADTQAAFKDLMLDQPKALDTPPDILKAAFDEGDIPLPRRLKVYRNNIVGSLTDILLANFPMLEKLVGKEFLEGMARSFALKNPPAQGCLNLYGEGFAEFIEGFRPAKGLPFLPDVARFELALNRAYYAKDDTALSAEALGATRPEELGTLALRPRHSVQLLKTDFPVLDIQAFCTSDGEAAAPDMDKGGDFIMVDRPFLETRVTRIDAGEYAMLLNLNSGALLGEALERTLADMPAFDFNAFLQKHITLESFSALHDAPCRTP